MQESLPKITYQEPRKENKNKNYNSYTIRLCVK